MASCVVCDVCFAFSPAFPALAVEVGSRGIAIEATDGGAGSRLRWAEASEVVAVVVSAGCGAQVRSGAVGVAAVTMDVVERLVSSASTTRLCSDGPCCARRRPWRLLLLLPVAPPSSGPCWRGKLARTPLVLAPPGLKLSLRLVRSPVDVVSEEERNEEGDGGPGEKSTASGIGT